MSVVASLMFVTGIVIAQASGSRTISGTVLTVDGAPASAAPVQLFSSRPKSTGGPVQRPPGASPTGDAVVGAPDPIKLQAANEKPIKETTTDSNGKFTLSGIAPGTYNLVAGKGRNQTRMSIQGKPDADPEPVTLKLPSK
jgi:hypothetical protein